MLEMQKNWAVVKEDGGTEKNQTKNDDGWRDDKQRSRWYEIRKKNTEENQPWSILSEQLVNLMEMKKDCG